MIKKLRMKFLIITFVSLFLVVGVIVSYINIYNHTNTMNKHYSIIQHILDNDGDGSNENNSFENIISRYTVVIDIKNGVASIRQGDLSDTTLDEIIDFIMSSNDHSGSYENYAYGVNHTGANSLIVLSNFERDSQLITTFLQNSVIISVSGVLCVYVMLFFSSSYVLKPFIKNEENQKEFITNASHELKTPITIIKANLDVLKIDNIENEWTISIEEQINRLELLTSNLIDLSKVQESDSFIKTDFSITDAIKEEAASYDLVLKEKNIDCSIELIENITFNGNEKQIRDIIKLLFDNIVKYSTGKMVIYNIDKELYFTNSTDLTDGDYNHIFNRFTRISISRNQEIKGYGIGLSIVKKILDNHNCNATAYVSNKIFTIKIKL